MEIINDDFLKTVMLVVIRMENTVKPRHVKLTASYNFFYVDRVESFVRTRFAILSLQAFVFLFSVLRRVIFMCHDLKGSPLAIWPGFVDWMRVKFWLIFLLFLLDSSGSRLDWLFSRIHCRDRSVPLVQKFVATAPY